jgi:single-strand DNA-binding protein
MSTENKMMIIGYLGADPELRYTSSGRPVANFRVATTERWTDKAGTEQERTEWHRIVAWANLGEVVAKYLKKGKLVKVEGPLRTRKFTDKEGIERNIHEVIASSVLFLERAERQKSEDAPPADEEAPPF